MSRVENRQRKKAATDAGVKKRKNPFQWFQYLSKKQKIILVVCLVLAVILLALGIAGLMAYHYVNDTIDSMYVETPEDYDLSLTDVDGYINILLLGVDSRDMDNIDGTRSDAIMVVSINEETNDVKVISVYRDTYLKIGDTSTYDKVTHACAYGGPDLSMKTLNQAMDLNISNYVVVNFKAVADLVDAVGGVTVDVQDYEIQQLNKYTIQTANNIGRESYNLVQSAGVQTLEGVQAVSYGRIRKGVGDDFKRTERMRTVLTLVFNKMKTMSFSEIKSLIDLVTPQVKTNLLKSDILALGKRLPSFNIVGSVGWPYNVTAGYIGGVSYVLPSDLEANTIQLHQEVFEQADYSPSETVKAISSEVAYRIQSARSSNQISGETSVDTTPIQDPTQVEDPGTTVDGEGSGETPTDSSEGGGTTDPSATDPGANDSGTTGSGTTGSGTTEPGTTTTDPSGTDSDTSGSGAGTGESGGGGNVDGAGADGGTNSAPVDDDPDEQPAA